jgi:Transposase DDE domain group 1
MTSAVLRRCTSITWRAAPRVATILRPARTPKGTEVRTVIKHVTKRLRRHWPHTRIVWRGDSHYGRVEAMEWSESSGEDYIFGLGGNTVLDARVAATADNLRFHHAASNEAKLRTHTSWTRPRKVVARLECSLQPDTGGEITSTGMRQEVDIRYVVTSLKGTAQHLYEDVYCQRGQMENLIKLHKAQLASDRMSCHSATANQVRLVLHTAAFWLMHGVRAAIPRTNPLANCEFATLRERLIKIGARVIEHIARIRVQLPTSCPEGALFRTVALGLLLSGP